MESPTQHVGGSPAALELTEGVHHIDGTVHSHQVLQDDNSSCIFFEGPEKLLEVWFAESVQEVASQNLGLGPRTEIKNVLEGEKATEKLIGLRRATRHVWQDMLSHVNCKIFSVIEGEDVDAYLLSESSMFVWPHKFILKTCGKTTLLLGLESILDIAKDVCGLSNVKRLFFSHTPFKYPEKQLEPHKTWESEVALLEKIFKGGYAHRIGNPDKMGHWMLYFTPSRNDSPSNAKEVSLGSLLPSARFPTEPDSTIEILMTGLSQKASSFFYPNTTSGDSSQLCNVDQNDLVVGHTPGLKLLSALGLDSTSLFGTVASDAFLFNPCGFSANLITVSTCEGSGSGGQYVTYHVTPEQDWSFASFESNIDFTGRSNHSFDPSQENHDSKVGEVVTKMSSVFEPQQMIITLFVSKEDCDANAILSPQSDMKADDSDVVAGTAKVVTLDKLHSMMKEDLLSGYKRTDEMVHDFEEYYLGFATFERLS